jgi:hypothetical protein
MKRENVEKKKVAKVSKKPRIKKEPKKAANEEKAVATVIPTVHIQRKPALFELRGHAGHALVEYGTFFKKGDAKLARDKAISDKVACHVAFGPDHWKYDMTR